MKTFCCRFKMRLHSMENAADWNEMKFAYTEIIWGICTDYGKKVYWAKLMNDMNGKDEKLQRTHSNAPFVQMK